MTPKPKLDRNRAVVLVVDVQERLVPAIEPAALARVLKYAKALVGTAKELGMPVLATEQYPKGLGRTLPELAELLPAPPMEKVHFSCGADAPFVRALAVRPGGAGDVEVDPARPGRGSPTPTSTSTEGLLSLAGIKVFA